MMFRRTLSLTKLHRKQEKIHPLLAGFDHLTDHVIVTDSDAHILYANAAARKATGFTESEILGKNPGDLWGGHMPKNFYRDLWHRIKKDGKPFIGEVTNKTKSGRDVVQELRISPVLDHAGKPAFFIAVEPDVTERAKSRTFREEILSIVGNDSLAPATAVKWTLEGLLKDRALSVAQKKVIGKAAEENARLIAQIRDLIFLSDAKGHPLRTRVDLVKVIRRILHRLKNDCPHVTFTFKTALKTAAVLSHETLIEEMLSIPVSYAAGASERKGGKVDVQLRASGNGYRFDCRCGARISKREALLRHGLVTVIASYLRCDPPVMTVKNGREECGVRIPKTV